MHVDSLRLYARSIGADTYQVFVHNMDYPCDFIRIASGYQLRGGKKPWNYLQRQLIITPLKPGSDEIFAGEFTLTDTGAAKLWYKIDTCTSKPTKFVEPLEAWVPPKSRLPVVVGKVIELPLKPRPDGLQLKQHIQTIRVNIRDKIADILETYLTSLEQATTQDLQQAMADDKMIGQEHLSQLRRLDFSEEYNRGRTLKQAHELHGDTYETYYDWFIRDFELPVPTGKPPEQPFSLPIPPGHNVIENPPNAA